MLEVLDQRIHSSSAAPPEPINDGGEKIRSAKPPARQGHYEGDSPRVAMVGPRRGPPGLPFGDEKALADAARDWASQLSVESRLAVVDWSKDWKPILKAWTLRQTGRFNAADAERAYALIAALHTAPRWTGRVLRAIRSPALLDDKTGVAVRFEPGEVFNIGSLRAFTAIPDVALAFAAPPNSESGSNSVIVDVVDGSEKGTPFIAMAVAPEYRHQAECLRIDAGAFRILRVSDPEVMVRVVKGARVAHTITRIVVKAL